jgi:hypothetical protein
VATGRRIAVRAGAGLLALAALGGCTAGRPATREPGAATGASGAAAGTSCGKTRTGVNVTVVIKVARGRVDCATALRVEQGYASAIRNGGLQGNGGGAPVAVDGWTCQTYPTTRALTTGEASECHTASAEVVAELALPPMPPMPPEA